MITFKSSADLHKLGDDHPAHPLVKDLDRVLIEEFPEQPYDAEDHGHICLVEPQDTNRVPERLAERLLEQRAVYDSACPSY